MVVLHAGNGESRGDTDGCRNGGGVGGPVGVVTLCGDGSASGVFWCGRRGCGWWCVCGYMCDGSAIDISKGVAYYDSGSDCGIFILIVLVLVIIVVEGFLYGWLRW